MERARPSNYHKSRQIFIFIAQGWLVEEGARIDGTEGGYVPGASGQGQIQD